MLRTETKWWTAVAAALHAPQSTHNIVLPSDSMCKQLTCVMCCVWAVFCCCCCCCRHPKAFTATC